MFGVFNCTLSLFLAFGLNGLAFSLLRYIYVYIFVNTIITNHLLFLSLQSIIIIIQQKRVYKSSMRGLMLDLCNYSSVQIWTEWTELKLFSTKCLLLKESFRYFVSYNEGK